MSSPTGWTPEDLRALAVVRDALKRNEVPGVNPLIAPGFPWDAVPQTPTYNPGAAAANPGAAAANPGRANRGLNRPLINGLGLEPGSRGSVQPGTSTSGGDVRMGSPSPERDQAWFGHITEYRFTCRRGSTIEDSWSSDDHNRYMEMFRDQDKEVNVTFTSIMVSFLESNVPLRTMRFTRLPKDGMERIVYMEDHRIGTWTFEDDLNGSAFLVVDRAEEPGKQNLKWFENVPGTAGWCRRPDTWNELGFACFLFPMWHTVQELRPGLLIKDTASAPESAESTLEVQPASSSSPSQPGPSSAPTSPSAPGPNQPGLS